MPVQCAKGATHSFQGFFTRVVPKSTALYKGSSEQRRTSSHQPEVCKAQSHAFPLPLEQGCAKHSENSLPLQRPQCDLGNRHATVRKPVNCGNPLLAPTTGCKREGIQLQQKPGSVFLLKTVQCRQQSKKGSAGRLVSFLPSQS